MKVGEERVVIVFVCAVSSGDCEHFSGTELVRRKGRGRGRKVCTEERKS